MLDLTKPISTRDGRPVMLITTQGREPWPLIGYRGKDENPTCWRRDGSFYTDHESNNDLINIPEPKRSGEVWVSILKDGSPRIWSYKNGEQETHTGWTEYQLYHHSQRIACVRVPWTEGEGLEGK